VVALGLTQQEVVTKCDPGGAIINKYIKTTNNSWPFLLSPRSPTVVKENLGMAKIAIPNYPHFTYQMWRNFWLLDLHHGKMIICA
jgi:hypothetical protein